MKNNFSKLLLVIILINSPLRCYGLSQFWYADSFSLESSPGSMSDINVVSIPMAISVPKGVMVTLLGCSPYEATPTLSGYAAGLVLNRKVNIIKLDDGKRYSGEVVSGVNGIGWVGDKYVIYGNHIKTSPWQDYCDIGRHTPTMGVYSLTSSVEISLPSDLPAGKYTLETGVGSAGFITNIGDSWNPTEGLAIVNMLGSKGLGTSTTINIPQRTTCEVNNSQSILLDHGDVKINSYSSQSKYVLVNCTGETIVKIYVTNASRTSSRVYLTPGKSYTDLTLNGKNSQLTINFGSTGGNEIINLKSNLYIPDDANSGEISGVGIIILNME